MFFGQWLYGWVVVLLQAAAIALAGIGIALVLVVVLRKAANTSVRSSRMPPDRKEKTDEHKS